MAQLNDLLVTGNSRFLNEINGQIDWSNILNKPAIGTGTITSVKTTAGAHTTINVTSGAANFNVPTKTSHLTNDSGFVTTDTKNTAGSTDTSSKIYLIGATSQTASSQTYSQDTAYVGTDGCLYSGGSKVLTSAPVSSVAGKTGAVTLTSSDVGLGNVGNFKAVSTVASQGLTATEQSNARANIGAGTSSLTLGTTSTTALKGDTKYAGASTAGGAATSAAKLTNTSKIGDTNKPVYFTASGVPSAISYTIGKSVPSDAVFTDTTYTIATGDSNGQIKVTPTGGTAYNVDVKGLGSNAYSSTAYLPLTGGALSGDLSMIGWAEPKNNDITIGTTSNNGVSSGTKSSGARWTDSNDFWYGAAYGTCNSSGQSIAHLASRNMKTNGDVVTSDFQVITNKDGTTSYHVGNPSAFQTAINNCSFKNWMDANETQSNIPGTNGCGFIIGANTRVSFYNVTGSAGSYALSVNSITSANITDWFTITCNATTGLLTVKNKHTSAHYLTIIGVC